MDLQIYALLKRKIEESTYDDTELRQKLLKVIEDVNVINGNGEGSISKAVADEIAKVIAGAPESFDTLKELSDWINTHSESAAAMNNRIAQNENAIDELKTDIVDLPKRERFYGNSIFVENSISGYSNIINSDSEVISTNRNFGGERLPANIIYYGAVKIISPLLPGKYRFTADDITGNGYYTNNNYVNPQIYPSSSDNKIDFYFTVTNYMPAGQMLLYNAQQNNQNITNIMIQKLENNLPQLNGYIEHKGDSGNVKLRSYSDGTYIYNNSDNIIVDVPVRISDSVDDKYYPRYFDNELISVKNSINSLFNSGVIDSFVFFTDTHVDLEKTYEIPLINNILDFTPIRFSVFGGDIITEIDKSYAMSVISEYYKKCSMLNNFYPIVGNHEYNNPGGNATDNQLSNAYVFGLSIDKYEDNYTSKGLCSYRVDNKSRKITYFYLGCGYLAKLFVEDIKWFAEELTKIEDGYKVIVFSHPCIEKANDYYFSENVKPIADSLVSFKNKSTFTYGGVEYDYSDRNGVVVAMFGGHIHKDYIYNYNGITFCTTTCSTPNDSNADWIRTKGTSTETAFDVIVINESDDDNINGTVNLIRFGAGENRQFTF